MAALLAGVRVLFLDDVRPVPTSLMLHDVTVVRSAAAAKQSVLDNPTFDLWSLDHDLGMEILGHRGDVVSAVELDVPTGYDFLKWAEAYAFDKWAPKIHVHSANPVGKANMEGFIWNVQNRRQR